MMGKSVLSNKGSAIYYVMIVLILITLILSGVIYTSMRTATIANNRMNENVGYVECDAALNKIIGTLRACFLDNTLELPTGMEHDDLLFSKIGVDASGYYYPINGSKDFRIEKIFSGSEMIIKGNIMENGEYGFEVDIVEVSGKSTYIIKDVVAQKGSVEVSTDIVLTLQSGIVTSITFDNYRVSHTVPQATAPDTGAEGEGV